MVTADIKDISYNVHISSRASSVARYSTVCKVEVDWKITSGIDNTKIERQTTGNSIIFENGGSTAFYDAFENSFYEFLQEKSIYTKLSQENAAADSAMEYSYIRIPKPKLFEQNEKVINNAVGSVVTVTLENGHGSGCIVSSDGYIVTNYHVIEGNQKVNVNFKSGISLQADVVRTNPDYDLALLKVTGSGFSPFLLSEDKDANIGADVFSIGTPADLSFGQTVSKGIISGERVLMDKKFIQTDVSISPGNSGGALVDKRGVLIGITNAKFVGTGVEGIGFAIPAYQVFEKLKIGY
jgi:S1-C subfamily serine protease